MAQQPGCDSDFEHRIATAPGANAARRVDDALDRAAAYVLGRQSPQGGFCFYRSVLIDEPNLHDTYYAVRALSLLGKAVPARAALLDFLQAFSALDAHGLFFRVFIADAVGAPMAADMGAQIAKIPIAIPAASTSLSSWLFRCVRVVRLKYRLERMVPASMLADFVERQERAGGFGEPPNLGDTYLALRLLKLLDALRPDVDRAAFIDGLQEPRFGFRPTVDAVAPNLDTLYAGVGCCGLLAHPVRYAEPVLNFILASQADNGGFARVPDALPDLEYTYRAIATIRALGR